IIPTALVSCYFFFFSSRRRHTRSKRDWSSDVCSSDLVDTAREALERSRTDRDEARVAAVRAQTTHEQATTTAQNLNARLAADRESDSDESLDERVTEAKAQAQEREEAVASARARYQASDPETLEMRLQNARGLLESKQKQQ